MRRLLLGFIALLFAQNALAMPQQRVEKVRLYRAKASDVEAALLQRSSGRLPSGITSLSSLNLDNSLIVRGSPAAIEQFKEAVKQIDVEAPLIRLEMRVLRFNFHGGGVWDVDVVGEPMIATINNTPAQLGVGGGEGYSVTVTPHLNADDSLSLTYELRVRGGTDLFLSSAQLQKKVEAPYKVILTGVTEARDAGLKKSVARGVLNPRAAPHVAYYLQLKRAVIERPASQKK